MIPPDRDSSFVLPATPDVEQFSGSPVDPVDLPIAPVALPSDSGAMTEFVVPDQIGPYRLQKCIGRGTCGRVYLAFDTAHQRDVAVKLSAVQREATREGKSRAIPASYRAFLNEAAAAGKLRHPHIVALLDAGVGRDFSYLVTEYVDGDTLRSMIKRGDIIGDDWVLQIILQ